MPIIQVGDLKLYSVEEVSAMIKLSLPTLRRCFRKGKIRAQKIGKRWYVSEKDLRKEFLMNYKMEEK